MMIVNKEELITLCYEAECDRLKKELNEYVYNLEHRLEREHQTNLNLLRLIEIYEERIDKTIKYIESNNETLYTYEPDYDYEENIVDNYDVSNYREDLLKILRGEINE